jgi:hypothetical protein
MILLARARAYFGTASFVIALNKANHIIAEQRIKRAADLIEARARLRFRHRGADRVHERSNNRERSP